MDLCAITISVQYLQKNVHNPKKKETLGINSAYEVVSLFFHVHIYLKINTLENESVDESENFVEKKKCCVFIQNTITSNNSKRDYK